MRLKGGEEGKMEMLATDWHREERKKEGNKRRKKCLAQRRRERRGKDKCIKNVEHRPIY